VTVVEVHIGEPSYLLQQRAEFLNSVASRELRGKPELERTLSAEPLRTSPRVFQRLPASRLLKAEAVKTKQEKRLRD